MQLNVYELLKWLNENKKKVDNARIKTIHRTHKRGIIIELFKPSLDKKYLYLIPGEVIFLSNVKLKKETDNFVMKLRKDFSGKRISIDVIDFERAVVIEAKDTNKKIVVELFHPGNIIILNNDVIEYAQVYRDYGIRKIFKGLKYSLPPSNFKIPKHFEEFEKLILNTNRRDFVRFLAIDLRLGKKYSEWLLEGVECYKNYPPKEVPQEILKKVWEKYNYLINSNDVLFESWSSEINNTIEKNSIRELENSEIAELEKKKEKILKILHSQKESIEKLKDKIEKYKLAADFLSTFSWVFKDKDINKIENRLKELGLEAKITKDGYKLRIEIDENKLKEILGYSE